MSTPQTIRSCPGLGALTLLSVVASLWLLPSVASADRGRVHLEDGSTIQGEIVRYDPGTGVTLQLANGSTIELSADEVARVEIGLEAAPAPAPSPTAVAPAPAPYAAPAPAPTPGPATRRPRIAGPIVMGSVGLLLTVIGAPLYTLNPYGDDYRMSSREIAGATLLGLGGAMTISGFGVFLGMRVKKRRAWDQENRVALRLTPSLSQHHAGLRLSGTF